MSANDHISPATDISCNAVRAMLLDYVDSTLPADSTRAVNLHLSACSACAAELGQVRRAEAALAAAAGSAPAPGDLYDGFIAKLSARRRTSVLWIRAAVPAFACAGIALILATRGHSRSPLPGQRGTGGGVAISTDSVSHGLLADSTRYTDDVTVDVPALRRDSISGTTPSLRRRAPSGKVMLAMVSLRAVRSAGTVDKPVDGPASLDRAKSAFKKDNPATASLSDGSSYIDRATSSKDSNLSAAGDPASTFVYQAKSTATAPPAVAFAVYVEDDVRGFTAEEHDSGVTSFGIKPRGGGENHEDGFRIEVETDGER